MPTISVKGLDEIIGKFEDLSKNVQNEVQLALNSYIIDVQRDAKTLVTDNSSYEGNLGSSIDVEYGDGTVAIFSRLRYAAYIEFGTRRFAAQYVATLPQDWQTYAATFKGKGSGGGTFDDFLIALTKWAEKRYGIKDPEQVYNIAKKIMILGIRPKPFLYPSINKNLPQLIADLKDIVK